MIQYSKKDWLGVSATISMALPLAVTLAAASLVWGVWGMLAIGFTVIWTGIAIAVLQVLSRENEDD